MEIQIGIVNVQEEKRAVSHAKTRRYFAIQTAKHKKNRYEPRYKQVAPNVWIKTF